MTGDPRKAFGPARLTRRTFLLGSAAVSGAVFLDACGSRERSTSTGPGRQLQLASPEHPVAWPVPKGSEPIPAGMQPERNATLKLFNWSEYINKDVVKDFEKQNKRYNVKVEVSTFNTMEEALAKLRSGKVAFDVFFPTYDRLGKLVQAGFLRALTHSYVPNIHRVWPTFSNPFYDQGWRFSVPYTVYTTGIAWRVDNVPEDVAKRPNPYDVLWDPRYKGRVGILDDYREAISMALLRNGGTDLNTGDQAQLEKARDELLRLATMVNPRVNNQNYIDLPEGRTWVNQAWSGDMVNAQYYFPKGQSAEVVRYWFSPDGKGAVNNDLMVLLRSGRNPVLGHRFLNYLLDYDVALKNLSFTGYQPPQTRITPEQLVTDGYIQANLKTAVVRPEYVTNGLRELELSPGVDSRWQRIWQEFKAGA